MSVGKRTNSKYYWMQFTFNGQKFQKSTKCTNRRDAEAVEAAFRTQLAKSEVGITPKIKMPTFGEAISEWTRFYQLQHANKPNTVRCHKESCKTLLMYFKHSTRLDAITVGDVEKFKLWRKHNTRRPPKPKSRKPAEKIEMAGASVNRDLAAFKMMFNFFIKNGVIVKNPVSSVKFLPENLNRWKVIDSDVEKRYLLAASEPLQSIATLMLETGSRPDELFRLERKNIDLDESILFITDGKTKSARRRIPLSNRAFDILSRRLAQCDGNYVFANPTTGKPITSLKKAHLAAIKRSKVERFRLYDLRHTFASRVAAAGVDLVTLRDILGHTSLAMTMRYAHGNEQNRRDAINKMEQIRLVKSS